MMMMMMMMMMIVQSSFGEYRTNVGGSGLKREKRLLLHNWFNIEPLRFAIIRVMICRIQFFGTSFPNTITAWQVLGNKTADQIK